MTIQEAKKVGFAPTLDSISGLQYCPKAAARKRMPQKSTPPLPQPPPPPSRPPQEQPSTNPLVLIPAPPLPKQHRNQKRKAGSVAERRTQCNRRSPPPSPPSPISVAGQRSRACSAPPKKNNLDGRPPAPPEALSPVPSVHSIDYDGSPTEMPIPTEIPTPPGETVCKTPPVGIRENSPGSHASRCSSISDTDSELGKAVSQTPECPNNHAGNESDGTETESASPTVATVPVKSRKYSPTEYSSATDASSAEESSAEESTAEVSTAKMSIANYAAKVILPTTEKNEG